VCFKVQEVGCCTCYSVAGLCNGIWSGLGARLLLRCRYVLLLHVPHIGLASHWHELGVGVGVLRVWLLESAVQRRRHPLVIGPPDIMDSHPSTQLCLPADRVRGGGGGANKTGRQGAYGQQHHAHHIDNR
jgi:hypothetical protein